jgi:hypothetical protein
LRVGKRREWWLEKQERKGDDKGGECPEFKGRNTKRLMLGQTLFRRPAVQKTGIG